VERHSPKRESSSPAAPPASTSSPPASAASAPSGKLRSFSDLVASTITNLMNVAVIYLKKR
jgi:hypothetical protein